MNQRRPLALTIFKVALFTLLVSNFLGCIQSVHSTTYVSDTMLHAHSCGGYIDDYTHQVETSLSARLEKLKQDASKLPKRMPLPEKLNGGMVSSASTSSPPTISGKHHKFDNDIPPHMMREEKKRLRRRQQQQEELQFVKLLGESATNHRNTNTTTTTNTTLVKRMLHLNNRGPRSIVKRIQVFFHVIQDESGDKEVEHGNLLDERIHAQINYLNHVFKRYNFQFYLYEIQRTRNTKWFQHAMEEKDIEQEMKMALGKGFQDTLNIYTVKRTSNKLGFAYLPHSLYPNPLHRTPGIYLDGIVLSSTSLPDNPNLALLHNNAGITNGGKTLVHEAGHFLGLYHTFEGSCTYPNDFIADTRPQKAPSWLSSKICLSHEDNNDDDHNSNHHDTGSAALIPLNRKSCANSELRMSPKLSPALLRSYSAFDEEAGSVDAVENYMDYSDEQCRVSFTDGQVDRMHAMWSRHRIA